VHEVIPANSKLLEIRDLEQGGDGGVMVRKEQVLAGEQASQV
jgi:hypothetical protein